MAGGAGGERAGPRCHVPGGPRHFARSRPRSGALPGSGLSSPLPCARPRALLLAGSEAVILASGPRGSNHGETHSSVTGVCGATDRQNDQMRGHLSKPPGGKPGSRQRGGGEREKMRASFSRRVVFPIKQRPHTLQPSAPSGHSGAPETSSPSASPEALPGHTQRRRKMPGKAPFPTGNVNARHCPAACRSRGFPSDGFRSGLLIVLTCNPEEGGHGPSRSPSGRLRAPPMGASALHL